MTQPDPKTPDNDEDAKPTSAPQSDQDSKDLEDAQADAAEEREDEGGYQ